MTFNKPEGNYKHLSRVNPVSTPLFDVFLDTLELENDSIPSYLVVRPKRLTSTDHSGVLVLPMYNSKFYLMNVWRHHLDRSIWQAPSGFINPGEQPALAASRELQEETGFVCEPNALIPLGFTYPDPGILDASVALYLAVIPTDDLTKTPQLEVGSSSPIGMSFKELEDLCILSPDISAPSALLGLRALHHLSNPASRLSS